MKRQQAISKVNKIIDARQPGWAVESSKLMKKYQRTLGNRTFKYFTRLVIANGLWEAGVI